MVDTWKTQFVELAEHYSCIHVFENKGEIMGCSQPHPHGQIWAHNHRSTEIDLEDERQREYYQTHHRPLLADYIDRELSEKQRIIVDNEHWLAVVPYWAKWPFETLLVCKDDVQTFAQLNSALRRPLIFLLLEILRR